MTEFIAVSAKLYAYRKLNGVEVKRCKRIKKCVVRKTISFDDYVNCLLDAKSTYRSQLMFRNNKHEIQTVEVNKVALNRDDDKVIVKKDGVSASAFGHNSLCWNRIHNQWLRISHSGSLLLSRVGFYYPNFSTIFWI